MAGASEPTKLSIQEALLTIPKFGNGIGLHRMLALCRPLVSTGWMKQLDAIKVTGSNGKGSVSVMLASVLKELGISTGLYTSPHLLEFNERIMIDGQPISDAELAEAVEWFDQRRDEYRQHFPDDTIGAFEAFTSIALSYFAKRQPRALVAEGGIGGRYDSTRIIKGQFVGLTSLDLEHTALLGRTLELIAYDKADLCPDGGVIVTGVSDTDVLRRLRAYCHLRRITLRSTVEHSTVHRVSFGDTHMELDLELDGIRLSGLRVALQGHHQVTNVLVAILLLQEWLKVHEPTLSTERLVEAIRQGMDSLCWPGRFERIQQNPDVFVDVGHSPDAIKSLVRTVRAALAGRRILLVTGVSYDKEAESIVGGLLSIADAVVSTRAYHKGAPAEEILRIVRKTKPDIPAFVEATIEEAMRHALEYAAKNGMTVLVAGGLFLSMEAAHALRGNNPQDLRFF
jgi:dihydrofolate synthase/folylpolyglutamate synthase